MRSEHPDDFKALTKFSVTFHYYNARQSYQQVRPTIKLTDQTDVSSPIRMINWSPPFHGPLTFSASGISRHSFVAAAKTFDDLISAPESLFKLRIRESDCAIFDNWRVLHSRGLSTLARANCDSRAHIWTAMCFPVGWLACRKPHLLKSRQVTLPSVLGALISTTYMSALR